MKTRNWMLALLAAAVAAAIARRPVRQPTVEGNWRPADPQPSSR